MTAALFLSLFVLGLPQDGPTEADVVLLIQAGRLADAEALATKRIAADDKSGRAYMLRGRIRDLADKLPGAIEDFTAALGRKLDDKDKALVYDESGNARFMVGQIKESIADFDAYLALQPKMESQHWRRGIAYYYAGRFDDGRKQF